MATQKISEAMNWRSAIKSFDQSKKISQADLDDIFESVRLSPSSYGLQPWKFVVVTDKNIREQLKAAAWNQPQISDAEYLIVLCTRTDLDENYINNFIQTTAKTRNMPVESLNGYKDMLLNPIKNMSKEDLLTWSKKQVYIALGVLLATTAEKRIDSCPMEGFDSTKFDEILKLKEQNLTSTVLCPIGYRSKDDKYSNMKKVRFDKKDVFNFVR